jgi:hypothetical protein
LTLQFFPLFTSMLQCLIFSCWIIHSWSDDTLDYEEFSRPISVEMPKSSYAICGIRCSRVGETAVRAPLLLNPKDTTSSRQQEGVVAWVEYQKVCSNYRSDDGLIFLINCVRRRFFIIAPACQMVVVVVECGGAMMSRVCCLLGVYTNMVEWDSQYGSVR